MSRTEVYDAAAGPLNDEPEEVRLWRRTHHQRQEIRQLLVDVQSWNDNHGPADKIDIGADMLQSICGSLTVTADQLLTVIQDNTDWPVRRCDFCGEDCVPIPASRWFGALEGRFCCERCEAWHREAAAKKGCEP